MNKVISLQNLNDTFKDLSDLKYLKSSIDSYNQRFNSYVKLTRAATIICLIFSILLIFFTLWLFHIQENMYKIEENNKILSKSQIIINEVFKGDKK
ncbi:MAG: hypothetical protein ACRC6K_08725 [Fusobacteriaceae bacterium]